jgi:fucose permease
MVTPRVAVAAAFATNGFVYGSWVGRVPALAGQVGADEGALGVALLGQVMGLLAGASLGGHACAGFGTRRVTALALPAMCLALVVLSLPGTIVWLTVAFFLIGLTVGTLDVAMNISAVFVTKQLARPLMSFFHGVFSVGALAGAGGAALAAAVGATTGPHFAVVAVIGLVLLARVTRSLPRIGEDRATPAGGRTERNGRMPIRQPVLWLIAMTLFCAGIGEGAMANWSVLFLVEERDLAHSAGAVGYVVFSITTAVTRFLGEPLERRLGPFKLLRCSGAIAAAGILSAVVLPSATAGYLGLALAGAGFALVFPVAIGQAGKAGERMGTSGEREVGFVSAIAYIGVVLGPPAIGGVADLSSLAVALAGVSALVSMVVLFAWLAGRRTASRISVTTESPTGR